ncbi:TetR/AcrR family transcriptional regulator [uncultured Sulfitobacter sp.]|uniref:TetR/AcrR family transcriptional regulator n=1 Tax=uncultured Sulfitobacter sp. TaxID=191468 RepID=UPI002604BA0C|nr:TetR/AcrR family transcriptional regulator [uncultured Sulfitobacter sp.]
MGVEAEVLTKDGLSTVERITIAAELEFAERGFDGAGMKAISRRADVSQALLHYHFGSKDQLYTEVVKRRSKVINDERAALLDSVDLNAADALAQILDALFRPPLGPAGGDQAYTRIFGGLIVGRERERLLVKAYYDPTAQRFIDALQRIKPKMSRKTAAHAYSLALGALVAVISRDGRIERLMGEEGQRSIEDVLDGLVTFASGGIAALADREN